MLCQLFHRFQLFTVTSVIFCFDCNFAATFYDTSLYFKHFLAFVRRQGYKFFLLRITICHRITESLFVVRCCFGWFLGCDELMQVDWSTGRKIYFEEKLFDF